MISKKRRRYGMRFIAQNTTLLKRVTKTLKPCFIATVSLSQTSFGHLRFESSPMHEESSVKTIEIKNIMIIALILLPVIAEKIIIEIKINGIFRMKENNNFDSIN